MKAALILVLVLTAFTYGQDITSCEYWLDADPGQGNGTSLAISPSGEPTFDGTINTASLSIGLHMLGVRFMDDRDIWSSSDVRLFYVIGSQPGEEITAAEYWIDSDPGAGAGEALTITQGTNPVAMANLPLETLPIGLHSLGIRFKDDRDIWSSSDVRLFYVIGSQPGEEVIAAEYWVDSDPGAGAGEELTITQGTNPVAIANLPLETLPIGLHSLGIRFKDDRDIWSSAEVRLFYVVGQSGTNEIVSAEYWVDSDPGAGAGEALTITQGTNPVAIANLPLETLPIGLHTLGIRFKDDRDIWSSSDVRLFYVINPLYAAASRIISGAEFFVNHDPGEGNGVPIALPADGNWDSAFETLLDSIENIPGGKHWLGVRFEDDRGIWSNVLVDSFIVTPILSIGVDSSQLPVLYWQSADGANLFRIFRAASSNGPYTLIDSTSATNYTDLENPPPTSQRFYVVTEEATGRSSCFRLPAEVPGQDRPGEARKGE